MTLTPAGSPPKISYEDLLAGFNSIEDGIAAANSAGLSEVSAGLSAASAEISKVEAELARDLAELSARSVARATSVAGLGDPSAFADDDVGYVSGSGDDSVDGVYEVQSSSWVRVAGTGIDDLRVDLEKQKAGSLVIGNDSTMDSPSNWAAQVGSPILDYTAVSGELHVDFGAAGSNNSIFLNSALSIGVEYIVTVDLALVSGNASKVIIGRFASGGNLIKVTPTSTKTTYTVKFVSAEEYLAFGVIAADNNGCVISIDNIRVQDANSYITNIESDVAALKSNTQTEPSIYNRVNDFLATVSRTGKTLTKVCVLGDSLMANNYGGEVPASNQEGFGKRPIRMGINNIPRQMYDLLAFNKATHRRYDDADWTKSGVWTDVNTSDQWEPPHPTGYSGYGSSTTPSAYLEITIPDGQENFALICKRDVGFDTISVTLNGGSVVGYGPSSIVCDRPRGHASDRGNSFHTVEYNNLPSGTNVIRLSKGANASECQIWGGFYWSGNTLVVHNVARGGHDISDILDQHFQAEVTENNFDAIVFEIPIMNEMSSLHSTETTISDLNTILDLIGLDADLLCITPNPMGENPANSSINYYANFTDPTQKDTTGAVVDLLTQRGIPYVDTFRLFERKTILRGGTLLGGEAGLFYTTDGQHPSTVGGLEWFNMIKPAIANKPFN